MKIMKKSLSIILSVLMLASVCSVLMTSSVSAYSYVDKRVVYHDFEDETGVAQVTAAQTWRNVESVHEELRGKRKWGSEYTADPEDPDNTVFYMWNTAYNGYSLQIGNKGANGGGEDQALSLEGGKQYTLTFKYKYAAGSGGIKYDSTKGFIPALSVTVYKGKQLTYVVDDKKPLGDVAVESLKLGDANVISRGTYTAATEGIGDYDRLAYEKDTEWKTVSFGLTGDAAKDNIFLTISAGGQNVIGDQGVVPSFAGIYIDDICIVENTYTATESLEAVGTYVYDFKNAVGEVMSITQFGVDNNVNDSGRHAWFSNSHSASGKSYLTEDGAVLFSSQGVPATYPVKAANFIHKICLKDPDFQLGNSKTDVKGFFAIEAGNVYTITAKVKPYGDSANKTDVKAGIGLSGKPSAGMSSAFGTLNCEVLTPNTWNYVTATVDGDSMWDINTNGTVDSSNNNRVPCVFTSSSNTILIESVTVTVMKKAETVTVETYELDKAKVKSVKSTTATNVFSDAYRDGTQANLDTFVFTPSSSGRQRIPFFKAGTDNSETYNHIENVILEKGKTYRLELEYAYDATAENAGDILVGFMRTNNRTYTSWENGVDIANTGFIGRGSKSDKEYFECVFTADEAANGNFLAIRFSREDGKGNTATITIKSAKVTILAGGTDLGVSFTESSRRSIRAEGTVAGKYQSAGLRFRGTLTNAQVDSASEVGFVVVPASKIANGEQWFAIDADGKIANANAKKVECTNKVYKDNGSSKDYQLIVTNLTKENVTDRNLKDLEIVAVMYTKDANGEYNYYYVNSTSYNAVKDAYAGNGTTADSNGNNY